MHETSFIVTIPSTIVMYVMCIHEDHEVRFKKPQTFPQELLPVFKVNIIGL